MENTLTIEEGHALVIGGEDFVVLSVTDLGVADMAFSSLCQWGTHILKLERASDGACYAATRYASGEISDPFPFHFGRSVVE